MPLYLVRWPTLVASIVRAHDEDHLTDILDEVASPGDAVWTEYDGPLWVDVSLGVKAAVEGDACTLEGVEEAVQRPLLGASLEAEESDTSDEMFHTIVAKAFPHLYRLIAEAEPEATLAVDEVRRAAQLDLWDHRGGDVLPAWLRGMFAGRTGNGTPEA